MSKRTTLTPGATSPTVNLRTRSTGTVHAAVDGVPLCPARPRTSALGETQEPVSCKSCLKLTPAETVEAPAADVAGLTDDQLDGIACVRCESTDRPMVPAGTCDRGQVFECTAHVTREYGVRGAVTTPGGLKVRWKRTRPVDEVLKRDEVVKRLATFGRDNQDPETDEPGIRGDKFMTFVQLCMSSGMFLAHEAIDLNGYATAYAVTMKLARQELTEQDMAEILPAFRAMLARRMVPDSPAALDEQPCSIVGCAVCEVAA